MRKITQKNKPAKQSANKRTSLKPSDQTNDQ